MQEKEIEFKNLLNKNEYKLLKQQWFPNEHPTTQLNYYFETEDFQLRSNNGALRIRYKNGMYTATLKEPYEDGLLETHDRLTEEEFTNWIHNKVQLKENIKARIQLLNIHEEHLRYKGTVTTHRLEKVENGSTFVLDVSEYNGIKDYEFELEVEHYETGKLLYDSILNTFNLIEKPTKNKIQRFFESLK